MSEEVHFSPCDNLFVPERVVEKKVYKVDILPNFETIKCVIKRLDREIAFVEAEINAYKAQSEKIPFFLSNKNVEDKRRTACAKYFALEKLRKDLVDIWFPYLPDTLSGGAAGSISDRWKDFCLDVPSFEAGGGRNER